jgi:hypothetical protein
MCVCVCVCERERETTDIGTHFSYYARAQNHECKVKVFPVLLTEHDAMKTYWSCGGIAPLIP